MKMELQMKQINRADKNICLTFEEINYVLCSLESIYPFSTLSLIRAKRIKRELIKALDVNATIFE